MINRIHILGQTLKIYLPVQITKRYQSEQDPNDEKEQIENMLDTIIQTVKMNNQTFQNVSQMKQRIS
jgi:conjugal transfer/entry exclusion protein